MSELFKVTVLVENSVDRRALKAEHGLAWLLELGSGRVLFDTGQTDLFQDNAAVLGDSLESLDAIVLSHGHYDHTGGLAKACGLSPTAELLLHPDALSPKFTPNPDGSARFIGIPDASRRVIAEASRAITWTAECQEVIDGLFVTGAIPRLNEFEDTGGRFFVDAELRRPDPLADDQAMFCPTPEGTVVVLGCAHAGVVNTLRYIQHLTGETRFRAVLGGMHLVHASEARMEATIRALGDLEIQRLLPAHCTGFEASARLAAAFPRAYQGLGVGCRFSWSR